MNAMLPVCYFQTKTLFVDDDVSFIQSVLLKKQNKNCFTINCPNKALNYLLDEYQSGLPSTQLFKTDENIIDVDNQRLVSIDINQIQTFVTKNKSNEIGVIFVDYQMPEMSGIDFLRKIKQLPMKKILFTGYDDYQIGIQAFNEGLIDGYIRKGDVNFLTLLDEMETEQKWKFFEGLSEKIAMTEEFSTLNSIHLHEFLKSAINEERLKEFYLSGLPGDFVITDSENQRYHLLVRHITQLQELASLAEEDGASVEVVQKLKLAQAVPYFGDKNYWDIPASKWEAYLHELNAHGNNENYYYAKIPFDKIGA